MESTGIKSKIFFTLGLGVTAYAVGSSRKFTPWNQTAAKLQTAAFVISSAAFLAFKESKTTSSSFDKLYYLTSALLIGSAGFLSKLDWKINTLMTALFVFGQYGINQPSSSAPPMPFAEGPKEKLPIGRLLLH